MRRRLEPLQRRLQARQLLPDATIFSDRTASKIPNAERGWRYAAHILVKHGATEPPATNTDDPTALKAWLTHWTTLLTRPLHHAGNHRYAWSLSPSITVPSSHQYPKWPDPLSHNGVIQP